MCVRWVWELFLILFFQKITDFFKNGGLIFFGLGVGFVFNWSRSGFLLHAIEATDHEKDNEADNEEVNNGLDKVAVVDSGWFDAFNVSWDSKFE